MKNYNLHRFSKPEFLRQVDKKLLLTFLHRFPKFRIPFDSDGKFDYEKLGVLLASPDAETNTKLFDALALIDEMATDRSFDLLQDAVRDKPYSSELGDKASVGDLALMLWLNEPHTLETLHAKNSKNAPRSFIYYHGDPGKRRVMAPPNKRLKQRLNRLLNRIFQKRRRGRTVKIMVIEEPEEFHFMLRKGEPMTRDSVISDSGESGCVYYRPERYDIVLMRPKISEIRLTIYRKAPWIVEAYRTLFGHVFYGDKEYFCDDKVFTLMPLQVFGKSSLDCSEIDGLECVTMVQCKFETDGKELVVINGENAIGVLDKIREMFLDQGKIISAKFRVKFTESKKKRMVTIKAGNLAEFKFDDDGKLIEEWLNVKGFKYDK